MSSERREVSATLDFFQDLDRQLRAERGPNGEPSTNDFQTFELLEIVERFASGFDWANRASARGERTLVVCFNKPIAGQLLRRLGGPEPLPHAPGRIPVTHLPAGGRKEIRKRIRDTVVNLTGVHGVPLSQIAVLTTRTAMRDELLADPPDGCPLVRWEDRSEETVLCETVHRAKGLERTAVILVDMSSEPDPTLLYIGVSRAVSSLTLLGPPGLAHAVGVPEGAHGNGRST